MTRHIAIVGAGLVGSGWAIVFARAGMLVRVFDQSAPIRNALPEVLSGQLEDLKAHGLIEDPATVMGRIQICDSLARAVDGALYVQESVLERQKVKAEASHAIANHLAPDAIVGSSTSGIPGSAFTEDVPGRERFLVVHPVNPPYLVPVVELVPAPWTAPETVAAAKALMEEVGQSVVTLSREVEGFVLNRLQGALLREAWALFDEGFATAEDIDKTVRDGLGPRWSFMGPFETIDLNAPGGVADYARRLGPLYQSIAASRPEAPPWTEDLISRVERERRSHLGAGDLAERRGWRDRRLMEMAADRQRRTER
ncbi:MAG: 3-hydroxyacyl-CoA dehydrogenase [Rhodospirillum sp.]|nr:3-hydroxyacyl-CoA dehydrogenase [Rhodospirillum sp.]MCF8491776.1 3-hydroxyacyl-CoA dehydrogenase [Rhodospirillum sp.]